MKKRLGLLEQSETRQAGESANATSLDRALVKLSPFRRISSFSFKFLIQGLREFRKGVLMSQQLDFDSLDFLQSCSESIQEVKKPRKRNPNRVQPEDLTLFLDRFLPEYKEDILDGTISEGEFQMPKLEAVHNVSPIVLLPFNAVMSLSLANVANFVFFHFFVHDYQFERFWRNPQRYLPFLKQIGQGIGPDFSMYLYMHQAEAIINCCRNRLLTFYLQKQGLTVIPNVCFGNEQTYSWAFDGLPEHSVLAVTSQGCILDRVAKRIFLNGLHELDRSKHPELLYVYGQFPDEWKDKFRMEIQCLPTFSSKLRRAN